MQTPVKFVKRIGERIAAGLHERGIETVEDLLYHLPFRYEDRLHPKPLSAYQPGRDGVGHRRGPGHGAAADAVRTNLRDDRRRGSAERDHRAGDGRPAARRRPLGSETVKCLWFHGSYLKDRFRAGQRIALYGKLEGSRSGNALNAPPGSTKFKMVQPTFEILPDASCDG